MQVQPLLGLQGSEEMTGGMSRDLASESRGQPCTVEMKHFLVAVGKIKPSVSEKVEQQKM